jgi:ABC-type Mn2+/Zn2+ transport system permease subunit
VSFLLNHSLLASTAVAVACAMLSVFVVARRWAFLGEGVGHSGFGGAGIVWILVCLFPSLRAEQYAWLPWLGSILLPIIAAGCMGVLSRRGQISGDVSIGIFLVACVAVGFVGQRAFENTYNLTPTGFDSIFWGEPTTLSRPYVISALCLSAAIVVVVTMLKKELLAYSLDPALAETSGVRVGFIHYLLILMITIVVIIGVRLLGILLISALLVLPGATASLLSKRYGRVQLLACATALIGAWGGVFVGAKWTIIPMGPAMVLMMFVLFCAAYVARRRRAGSAQPT